MGRVCVIGAGPAGSVFAARLAELGHAVTLIEREAFPRPRVGESLSPGVPPLLDAIGAGHVLAGGRRSGRLASAWEGAPRWREDGGAFVVDRGRFDALLLAHARARGARVEQPARVISRERSGGVWRLTVETGGTNLALEVDFLAEAGGRRAAGQRLPFGAPTLALHARCRSAAPPVIEAGPRAWYWGMPLPDGGYRAFAFTDPRAPAEAPFLPLPERFSTLLAKSALLSGIAGRVESVQATDATAYLVPDPIARDRIALGEAALALDPVSSSGVQKAIQTALAAAVVTNTLLRAPASAPGAMDFYRATLRRSADQHRDWAARHHRAAAARWDTDFWRIRAAGATAEADAPEARPLDPALATRPVMLSRWLGWVERPCVEGEFIVVKPALDHPGLGEPAAYLGGHELAPLIAAIRPGATPAEIAGDWSGRLPFAEGLALAFRLIGAGVLVAGDAAPARN